jgi:hypothetical protein
LEFEFEFKIIGDIAGILENVFGAMKIAHTSAKSLCAKTVGKTCLSYRCEIFFDVFFDLAVYFFVRSEGDREVIAAIFPYR